MIQIDIEMPEKCGLCPLFHAEHPMHCQGIKADRKKKIVAPYGQLRPDWCPLHEVIEIHTGYVGVDDDYPVSVKQVLNITAELGALETQSRVRELPRYQVTDTDTVSRQATVEICFNGWNKNYREIAQDIKDLPSAQPYTEEQIQTMQDLESAEIEKAYELGRESAQQERKKGRWIRNDNGTYSCSVCQSWIPEEQHFYARYCLCCGADMKGEQP